MDLFNVLWLLLSIVGIAEGFWRMPCHFTTGEGRIDPLMDPGLVSNHAHVIHGGSNFGMNTTYNDLMASNCTSCSVTQDKSAYWTPPLMFIYANGTTVQIPQVGGMLAYYLLNGENITAFPEGFRMFAGEPDRRNFSGPVPDTPTSFMVKADFTQQNLSEKAIGFNCLDYSKKDGENALYRHAMPEKDYIDANCHDGLRLELAFPSCWNGKDIDSVDHKSHVAYPDFVLNGGDCPDGFETRLVQLFYETIWATETFKGVDGEFVLANGDPTGCSYHGDFIMGWNQTFLQSAVDTCTNLSGLIEDCPLFNIQTDSEASTCKFEMPTVLLDDNCKGPREGGLCGNNPIQSGPAPATTGGSSSTGSRSSTTSKAATTSSYHPSYASYSPGTLIDTADQNGLVTINKLGATTSASISTPITSAEPIITSAPSTIDQSEAVIATSTYTTSGVVVELAIVEEEVTVTASAPIGSAKVRRHLDFHRHVHHGL